MNQHPLQPPFSEQEEVGAADPAPDEEHTGDEAREWIGLRPELLDRVLDP